MAFYRVSRNKYQAGDTVWETEIGKNALENISSFREILINNNENAVQNIISLPANQIAHAFTALKEAALEIVRVEKYIGLPCRFNNMMVFQSWNDALEFHENFRSKGFIYEIAIKNNTSTFTGDMNLLDRIKEPSINAFILAANDYWKGVLTDNPIKETILNKSCAPVVVKLKHPTNF